MRSAVACFGAVVALLSFADDAFAAPLITGLGGPVGYGTSCVPPNDDGSYPASGSPGMDLTPAFPAGLHFYAGTYTKGWINNNGSLSFNSAISTYTPNAFPGAPQPMIAPFWADVDTRNGSTCTDGSHPSGGGYPVGATCANPASDGVWWSITAGQIVITWDRVGFFNCHPTPVNSFQMIVSANACGGTTADGGTAGTNFDIEFRYATCGWETGDASGGTGGFGGTPAQGGFDSGDSVNFASLPGSRTNGVAAGLCSGSNLTPPIAGIWRFAVRGGQIMCPNAGNSCVTGRPGVCANGQLQCSGTSMTTCVSTTMPGPSKCNGLDNDCDGTVDTGPCPQNQVCVGTACVPACVEGDCGPGKTCTGAKVCVETACIGVTCPTGKRCQGGVCIDDCSGVTCPIDQVCRLGTCVDPCAGLNCGMGQVCEKGMCVPTCPCKMCATTESCVNGGHCVETSCAMKTCGAGQVCKMGNCIDACTGAVCPTGQECKVGKCVDKPIVDAGADGPVIVPPPPDTDSGLGDDGGGVTDGGLDNAGDFGDAKKSGCGCRTAAGGDERGLALAVGVGIVAIFVRRRRTKKASQER